MTFDALYEFTEAGLAAYSRVFTGQLDDSAIDLTDPVLVSRVPGTEALDAAAFQTAKDMAEAIHSAVGKVNLFQLLPRTGLWSWLTFVLRDQLFKRDASGQWKVGELHRWYPSDPNDWQKGQHHLVRMPVLLLHSLSENADLSALCRAVGPAGNTRAAHQPAGHVQPGLPAGCPDPVL